MLWIWGCQTVQSRGAGVRQLWGILVQSFPPLDTMSIKIKFCSILQTIQITVAKI